MILLLINKETYCLADNLDIDNSTISGNYDLELVTEGMGVYKRLVEADGVGLSGNMFSILDSIYNRRLCESFPSPGDRVVDILNGKIYDVIGRRCIEDGIILSKKLSDKGIKLSDENAAYLTSVSELFMEPMMLKDETVTTFNLNKKEEVVEESYENFIARWAEKLNSNMEHLKFEETIAGEPEVLLKALNEIINEDKETVLRSLTITYADYICVKNAVEKGYDSSGILYHILSLVEDEFER